MKKSLVASFIDLHVLSNELLKNDCGWCIIALVFLVAIAGAQGSERMMVSAGYFRLSPGSLVQLVFWPLGAASWALESQKHVIF